jgi:alkylation response protein AidB-like acyl-CoA dehydrogenase
MTVDVAALPNSPATDSYEHLAARFRPLFDRIAGGTLERERQRRLPVEEVAWLKEAGFGAVRVPTEFGGSGATLADLFRLLVELGQADSNFPQLLRGHFIFTEEQLHATPAASRDRWLRLIGDGALFGNATSERTVHEVGRVNTTLTELDGRLVLNGTKFYATGSLFADWINVLAEREPGTLVRARIPASVPGVAQHDDWDGFGQRITGSGTVELTDAEVDPSTVVEVNDGRDFQPAIAQLILLASLAGIARSAAQETTEFVRRRQRSYSHASAPLPKDDPLVQRLIGNLHSTSFAVEATLNAAVVSVHLAQQAILHGTDAHRELDQAELDVSQAQVLVIDRVLAAVTELFDVGGASIVGQELALDRHWRNARTLAVHNPVHYKARAIGDHALNGSPPIYRWTPGTRKGSSP